MADLRLRVGPRAGRALAGVALGANALQLAGVYWDVGWHHARGRETFWSPPHLAIYAGVALALLAAGVGMLGAGRRWGTYRWAALGPLIQGVAAPVDELWHRVIGQDVSIWSPPHLLGILGGMVGVLGWILAVSPGGGRSRGEEASPGIAGALAALLLAGALFALGEYDHDQASRGPWLYPVLTSLLAPWILVAARGWVGWRWAGTGIALGYTALRWALAGAVWAAGLPWMGVPPFIVIAAYAADRVMGRARAGMAGAAFGIAFTVTDYPLTLHLSGRAWGAGAWAGTLLAAAIAGWASACLGRWLAEGSRIRRAPG
ncbi:MAG TPA: hypothetical protein VIG69_13925 [Candidatus Methylomirabilis sp.]